MKKNLALVLLVTMVMTLAAFGAAAEDPWLTVNDLLKVPQADGSGYLLDNLKLPAAAADSTPITWASTNPAAISTSGVVTRQAEDSEVTLTASAAGKTDLQFHFKVPGTLTSVNDLPGVLQMLYSDDFEDGIVGGQIKMSGGGEYSEADGVLHMNTTTTGDPKIADIYFNADNSVVTQPYAVEAVLVRESGDEELNMRINDGPYAEILWMSGGKLAYGLNGNKRVEIGTAAQFGVTDTLKITVYVNTVMKTYDIWFNNKPAIQKVAIMNDSAQYNTSRVRFYSYKNNSPFYIDDFKVYTAKQLKSDEQYVSDDAAILTEASIRKVPNMLGGDLCVDNLELAGTGFSGETSITWTSTDLETISPAGVVTRGAEEKQVTLTANITKGAASAQKAFTFTVPAKNVAINGIPVPKAVLYEDTFDGDAMSANIKATTATGGTISQKNGKLYVDGTAKGNNIVDIFYNTDKSSVTEDFVTEYVLGRTSSSSNILCRENYDNFRNFNDIRWYGNYVAAKIAGKDTSFVLDDYDQIGTKIKLTIYYDFTKQSYSFWVDNCLIAENIPAINSEKAPQQTRIYTELANTYLTIDDYKAYTVDPVALGDAKNLEIGYAEGESAQRVLTNVTLPTTGANGSDITWTSDNETAITAGGAVTRALDDQTVTLTATITSAAETRTKSFVLTVLAVEQNYVERDLPGLTEASLRKVPDKDGAYLIDGLVLPVKGGSGRSDITWQSDNTDVIAADGTVIRPMEDTRVTLTASLTDIWGNTGSKSFTFTVAGTDTAVSNQPAAGLTYYEDDFSGTAMDSRIVVAQKNGTVKQEGGSLNVERTIPGSGNETMADIYMNSDKTEAMGDFVTEFVLEKSRPDLSVVMRMRASSNKDYVALNWNGDNVFSIHSMDGATSGTSKTVSKLDYDELTRLKVTVAYHTDTKTFNMWFNNRLVLNQVYSREPASATDLKYVRIYLENANVGTCKIDDFKYYEIDYQENNLGEIAYAVNGQPAGTLAEGTVEAWVNYSDSVLNSQPAALVIAQYDANGTLIGISLQEKVMKGFDQLKVSYQVSGAAGTKVKLLLLNGTGTLTPLQAPVEIQ